MAFQPTENSFPIKNISIYNDIYDLGLSPMDADVLSAYWAAFQGSQFTYIYAPGTKEKDFVLTFRGSKEAVIKLEDKDEVATKNNHAIFRLENKRYYLKFAPKTEDIAFLNHLGSLNNSEQKAFVFHNADELRDHMFYNDLPLLLSRGPLRLFDVETLYWIAGKHKKFNPKSLDFKNHYHTLPDYAKYIIDVIELADDTRVAIYTEKGATYTYYPKTMDGMYLRTYIVKPTSPAYNWTDPERYFSHMDKKTYTPKVFYIGPNPIFPQEGAIDKYARGQKHVAIENDTLLNIGRRETRKEAEKVAIAKAMDGLKKKMQSRINDLAKGKEFSYNEVTFRENEIEYEGQILSSKDITTKQVIEGFVNSLDDEQFNFEEIFSAFCEELIDNITPGVTTPAKMNVITAMIGVAPIHLERIDRINVDKIKTSMYYINGSRINKDEVKDVLLRAVCYTKPSDFKQFVESVSACSLRYHKFISSGLVLNVQDYILGSDIEFKIGLERESNRNFITLNGRRYLVRDSNRLLTLQGVNDMTRVINLLIDPTVVGISGKEVRLIIDNGKAALEVERAKQNEMLTMAVNMFNCQKMEEVLLDNGRIVDSGYTVKGKLREYLIDETTLRVFDYPTGKYLCMVDKGQNEHANIPRLVSRMFALANDSKLANEISTLQQS
jgi:hypothetical protein